MTPMLRIVATLLLVPTLVLASDQQVRDLIFADALAARDAAQAIDAAVYAPRTFSRAGDALAAAERDFGLERPLERIKLSLAEATQEYRNAETIARSARDELAGLIKLRDAANSVDAGLHDEKNWLLAERKFKDTIIEFERGDKPLAERRAAEAGQSYRQAELAGIKAAYLNEARRVLNQAERARAERYAPETFSLAQQLLATAEKELSENRYDTDQPRDLARQAEYEARHALYLANEVEQSRKQSAESFILAGELPLQQIAGIADLNVSFDEGYQPATRTISAYIRNLQQELRKVEQELYGREQQIAVLETQLSSLETRMGGISNERQALEVELERQARERAQFARIENMFSEAEADVLRDGSDVIIRLVGSSFPVGKSTIEPQAYGLLTTLMDAIRVFPNAGVTIEGHTDAYGGDAINMKLSQERADAVRAYLRANMNIDDSRVAAVGYGETRPISNNETKEGRKRNRRIDVVLHTKGRSGS